MNALYWFTAIPVIILAATLGMYFVVHRASGPLDSDNSTTGVNMHLIIPDSLCTEIGDSISIELNHAGDIHFFHEKYCQLYSLPGGSKFIGERSEAFQAVLVRGFCEIVEEDDPELEDVRTAIQKLASSGLSGLTRTPYRYDSPSTNAFTKSVFRVGYMGDVSDPNRFHEFPRTVPSMEIKRK